MPILRMLPATLLLLAVSGPATPPSIRVASDDPTLRRVDGRLLQRNAPVTGTVVERDASGQIIARTPYLAGRAHGVEQRWFADGQRESERLYDHGTKVGTHRAWWPNGQLRLAAPFAAGQYDGEVRGFWPDGQPSELRHYDRGREVSTHQSWNASGQPLANYVIRDGRRYGLLGTRLCFTARGDAS